MIMSHVFIIVGLIILVEGRAPFPGQLNDTRKNLNPMKIKINLNVNLAHDEESSGNIKRRFPYQKYRYLYIVVPIKIFVVLLIINSLNLIYRDSRQREGE